MIKADNISKIFKTGDKRIRALRPCSLVFPNKGFVLITGETGSGKSTLIGLLSGYEKPTTGDVKTNYDSKNYAAFVFQNSMLIDSMTLYENMEFTLKLYPNSSIDIDDRLKKFGLFERKTSYPTELSGGEKQRAALLRAVLENKPVIFLDEPTASLDKEHSEFCAKVLAEQAEQKLIVVVTHETAEFSAYADRIISLKNGEIVSDNSSNKVFDPSNTDKYICKKPRFGLSSAVKMSLASAKKSKTKTVLFSIALFLTSICMMAFVNIYYNEEVRQVYIALSSEEAVCMDFAPPDDEINTQHKRLSDEKIAYFTQEYSAARFFTVSKIIALDETHSSS